MGNRTQFEMKRDGWHPETAYGDRFVYLIGCREFAKIGIANDLTNRLAMMQTGCPYELKLLKHWTCEHPEQAEECLHANFERYRVRGEWFALPAKELAWLVSMPDLSLFTW